MFAFLKSNREPLIDISEIQARFSAFARITGQSEKVLILRSGAYSVKHLIKKRDDKFIRMNLLLLGFNPDYLFDGEGEMFAPLQAGRDYKARFLNDGKPME